MKYNQNETLVSIIVPCYNVEKYLKRCVDSITNQTYNNIEILLLDDGSTDNSGEIANELAKKDQRIKVLHKKNEGLGFARNSAITNITGNYVTFVDGDDVVSPSYIIKLITLINKYSADIAISQFIKWTKILPSIKNGYYKEGVLSPIEAVECMFYQKKFDTSAWGKLYKANLFNDIKFSNAYISQDLETIYKLILSTSKIAYSMEPTYYYYIRGDSLTGCKFNIKKLDIIKVINAISNNITPNYPDLIPAMECRILSAIFHVFLQVEPKDKKNANILWDYIKYYRKGVLMNSHARKKARVGSAISFMGKNISRLAFLFVKWER
jgi:glycosyltransferase involved in cell wall biosynthesis